jgi:hypothetical protein
LDPCRVAGGAEQQPPHAAHYTFGYCNALHQLLRRVGAEGIPEVERPVGRWFAAHSPAERAQLQTAMVARQLSLGHPLFEGPEAAISP